ncbi:hypothetical protein [Deinococcus cavernae]|nr:hypothetical protein [Deinococcus cavernae]
MNILTLVRQVPDAEARVKVSANAVDLEGTTVVIDAWTSTAWKKP